MVTSIGEGHGDTFCGKTSSKQCDCMSTSKAAFDEIIEEEGVYIQRPSALTLSGGKIERQ